MTRGGGRKLARSRFPKQALLGLAGAVLAAAVALSDAQADPPPVSAPPPSLGAPRPLPDPAATRWLGRLPRPARPRAGSESVRPPAIAFPGHLSDRIRQRPSEREGRSGAAASSRAFRSLLGGASPLPGAASPWVDGEQGQVKAGVRFSF